METLDNNIFVEILNDWLIFILISQLNSWWWHVRERNVHRKRT